MNIDKLLKVIDNLNVYEHTSRHGSNYINDLIITKQIFLSYISDEIDKINNSYGHKVVRVSTDLTEYYLYILSEKFYRLYFNGLNLKQKIELFEKNIDVITEKSKELFQEILKEKENCINICDQITSAIMQLDCINISKLEIKISDIGDDLTLNYIVNYKIDSISSIKLAKSFKLYEDNKLDICIDTLKLSFERNVIEKMKSSKDNLKLSLNEKYWLVDYAVKNQDFDLAVKLNQKRSKLPTHLKYKIDPLLVIAKLSNKIK